MYIDNTYIICYVQCFMTHHIKVLQHGIIASRDTYTTSYITRYITIYIVE